MTNNKKIKIIQILQEKILTATVKFFEGILTLFPQVRSDLKKVQFD